MYIDIFYLTARNNGRNEGNSRSPGIDNGAGGDKQSAAVAAQFPDSTVKSPVNANNATGKQRGKRSGRSRNNSFKSQSASSNVASQTDTADAVTGNNVNVPVVASTN